MNFLKMGIVCILLSCCFLTSVSADDWPMWRYDAGRTAASPQSLPEELFVQWVRDYPALVPTWDDPLNRDLMQFDRVYEPIVVGKTMLAGSNAYDRLVALDTETGEEKWAFYAEGPVRLPPVADQGNVYFVSDDGYLYCVDIESGELVWKYSGVPKERKILGNERLISTWPARGGPVIKDGVVYFASGIWPFMGVFLFALDAETGEEVWINDSFSADFIDQPHNSPSFASVAPQGILVISGEKLLVPGGRSVPACFDLKTGKMLYYRLASSGKTGGAFVCAIDDYFINYHRDLVTSIYDLNNGKRIINQFGKIPVLSPQAFYCMGQPVQAFDYANMGLVEYENKVTDPHTKEVKIEKHSEWEFNQLWSLDVDASGDLIKAGNRLYAGGDNQVVAIDLSDTNTKPSVSWQAEIDGMASRLIAADNKLFVVTLDGKIYTFGGEKSDPVVHPLIKKTEPLDEDAEALAQTILETSRIDEGYAFSLSAKNGELEEALLRNSDLRLIAIESDASEVKQLRERFVQNGLHGKRFSVQHGNPLNFNGPNYLASLMVISDSEGLGGEVSEALFDNLYRMLRPYGGTICIKVNNEDSALELKNTIQNANLPNAKIEQKNGLLLLIREGAIPGSSDWNHQYGNIANTVKSDDKRIKLPLGILWFGGSSNMDVLPRHGHGPPEQVVNGRLFIEGMDSLSARDVYTGRVLWKKTIPDLNNFGVYFDETYKDTPLDTSYNQVHIPGANARGTNYVVTKDKVYVLQSRKCLVLHPASGEELQAIELPMLPGDEKPPRWGYIGVYKDYLIAGADFVAYSEIIKSGNNSSSRRNPFHNYDITSSKRLMVMNRHSGEVIWTYESNHGMRHNAIVAGNDKIFCIDRMPDLIVEQLNRRGRKHIGTSRLLAFDITDGDIVWSETDNIFGTWLGYSNEHDILLQAGRASRDMLAGEPSEQMNAYQGSSGDLLWENNTEYRGPCIIHGDTIITEPFSFSLLTGDQVNRINPITGVESPWFYRRNYGCNYAIASEHLMTFRSAAAGFFDLATDGGTGNLGGFKSGCTATLVAANGVLNAPDYTRTCSCSYQNQTSLAMIHDPSVEYWTFNNFDLESGPVERLGINLGAPGDRKANNGTLWLEYPIVGGPSPKFSVVTQPLEPDWYLHHSSRFRGDQYNWVAASGVKGITQIKIPLFDDQTATQKYIVRLIFAEPERKKAGERVFNVVIQDQRTLNQFDIVKEAGAIRKTVVKEFDNVMVDGQLIIRFDSLTEEAAPILCGIELISSQLASRPSQSNDTKKNPVRDRSQQGE